MSGEVVASEHAATASHERGWRGFVLALLLMVAVTATSAWPPALALLASLVQVLVPIEQVALLVLVAIAACAVVGWWSGGRLVTALIWVAAAAWVLWKVPLPVTGYGAFLRGWAVSLGASFGVVCLVAPVRPLLTRAIGAVALTGVVMGIGFWSHPQGRSELLDAPARMMSLEYQQRVAGSLDRWHARAASPGWQGFAARVPSAASKVEQMELMVQALVEPVPTASILGGGRSGLVVQVAPALLALESLVVLALGWAAYHRLARVRIGPPVGSLRALRFNDQWIWGVIVGATVLLLPTMAEWRAVGINLLMFFGTLYALRGAGVLTWWIPDRVAGWLLGGLLVLVPILGAMWVLAAVLSVTITLGLGDTWRDFRAGAAVRRPPSP